MDSTALGCVYCTSAQGRTESWHVKCYRSVSLRNDEVYQKEVYCLGFRHHRDDGEKT